MSSNSSANDAKVNAGNLRKGEDEAIEKIAQNLVVGEKNCNVDKRTVKTINGVEMFDGKCAQWEKIAPIVLALVSKFALDNKIDSAQFILNLSLFLDANASSIRAAAADLAFEAFADGKPTRYSLSTLATAMGVAKISDDQYDKIDVNHITWGKIHKVLYIYKAKLIIACRAKGNTAVLNQLTKSEWTNMNEEGLIPFSNPYAYLYVPANLRASWLTAATAWANSHANSKTTAQGVKKRSADSWTYSAKTFFNNYVAPLDISNL